MGKSREFASIVEDLKMTLEYLSTGVSELPLEGKAFKAATAGNPGAGVVFVSITDGRGPFEGEEGKLLSKMIKAMGLSGDEAWVIYAVETGEGGDPDPGKILDGGLKDVKPRAVVAFGERASSVLLGSPDIVRLRGRFHRASNGLKVMPTYEPGRLLREPGLKKQTWNDLKAVMKELGMKIPPP